MPIIPVTQTSTQPGGAVLLTDLGGGVSGMPAVDGSLLTGVADYAGKFEGTTIGTGDIADGKWGWWWNTTLTKMFQVRNRGGTLYAVESNPLP
jgi:hypothetical protein